jgi:hypothetical protein
VQSTLYSIGPREIVASYATHEEAQDAIDHLGDRKFEVERLAIVAGDLAHLERVTAGTGYGRAALQGGLSGALTGMLIGLVVGLWSFAVPPTAPDLTPAIWAIAIGAALGTLVGLAVHGFAGLRDEGVVHGLHAGHYDIVAEPAIAEAARQALARPRLRH